MLEIGCGIGTDAVNFARAGARYTGVELSEVSLALTKQRFAVFGLDGEFYNCNAEHLTTTLGLHGFDLVYSFGVIHHTPNQRAIIEQARQVIRDGGELRIMLYSEHSWKTIMIKAGFDQPEAQAGCPIATPLYTPYDRGADGGLGSLRSSWLNRPTSFPTKSKSTCDTNTRSNPGSRPCRRPCSPRSNGASAGIIWSWQDRFEPVRAQRPNCLDPCPSSVQRCQLVCGGFQLRRIPERLERFPAG